MTAIDVAGLAQSGVRSRATAGWTTRETVAAHASLTLFVADAWGLCFAEGSGPIARAQPMGLPLAYLAITFVLGLLALRALWGVLRPRRVRYA